MRLVALLAVALLAGCASPSRHDPGPDVGASGLGDPDPLNAAGEPTEPPAANATPAPAHASSQDTASSGNQTAPSPPPPMHWEGGEGIVAVPAVGPWSECGTPLTGCDGPFFRIEDTFDLEATLSWDLPTNDFDLHLCRWVDLHCDEVSHDGIDDGGATATRQVLRHPDLPAGDYRLWIVPQHGVDMTYELDAVFR